MCVMLVLLAIDFDVTKLRKIMIPNPGLRNRMWCITQQREALGLAVPAREWLEDAADSTDTAQRHTPEYISVKTESWCSPRHSQSHSRRRLRSIVACSRAKYLKALAIRARSLSLRFCPPPSF
jgi:hypothetical protein